MTGKRQQLTVKFGGMWRLVIGALMVILAASAAFGQSRPRVTVSPAVEPRQPVMLVVDGELIEAESMEWQRGDQIMVWLRDLENIGWGKTSPGEAGSVLFQGNGITLAFAKNDDEVKVNSLAIKLPVSTYLKDGKLMVPLSFVARSLGYEFERSYKLVASINTKPDRSAAKTANTVCGKVTYAGKGIGGITVRAVDSELKIVKGAVAKTANDGSYRITGLPNGEFMAYVYVGENPGYFNRKSEAASVKGGETVQVKPLPISRIIDPVSPSSGAKLMSSVGQAAFAWSACPSAASYQFAVNRKNIDGPDYWVKCKTPSCQVPVSKLKAGAVYEITVTAFDAAGNHIGYTVGEGGKPWTFSVAAPAARSRR